jgi:von Willebrand factor type A domain
MRVLWFIVALVVLVCPAIAEQDAAASCTATISVSAFDEYWRPLTDLRPNQLRLRIGKQVPKIELLQLVVRPARIVFVFDGSGSMVSAYPQEYSRWKVALQTAADMVVSAPAGTAFGAVTFGAPGTLQLELTADKQKVLSFLSSMRDAERVGKGGHTPLYDSILQAVDILGVSQPNDALFVMTDGGENASKATRAKVLSTFEKSPLAMAGLLFVESHRTPEEVSVQMDLQEIAANSGGMMYGVSGDLLRRFKPYEIVEEIRKALTVWDAILYHAYALQIQSDAHKREKVTLSFDSKDKALRSVKLVYSHRLPPCSQAQQVAGAQ